MKEIAQYHTADRWLSEGLNPGHIALGSMTLAFFSAASSFMWDVQLKAEKESKENGPLP